MGAFDYVNVSKKVLDLDFCGALQTKDLECSFENYYIDDNGALYHNKGNQVVRILFSDGYSSLELYSSIWSPDKKEKMYVGFCFYFADDKVSMIVPSE